MVDHQTTNSVDSDQLRFQEGFAGQLVAGLEND
jgi:hypothetical protein